MCSTCVLSTTVCGEQLTLCVTGESLRRATTIDMLSDDVFLEIFDSYRKIPVHEPFHVQLVWPWHLLVHVCRRWRQIIFGSPYLLNLRILCTQKTPVEDNLLIWPTLPIVIRYSNTGTSLRSEGVGNVIAALRRANRVCHVELNVTNSMLETMVALMQEPFPELTHIDIFSVSTDGGRGVLPKGFLGGSAPARLQEISFHNLSFPSLPTFLLSTSNLISLTFSDIPPTDYIAPEAMITCLVVLHRLEKLFIGFQSVTSRPDRVRPPLFTRNVLPALTSFTFNGACEYLEDLVAQIDSPRLRDVCVDCWNPLVGTPVAQLPEFVDRTIGPKLTIFSHAQIGYSGGTFSFIMYNPELHPFWDSGPARVVFSCDGIGWRVSHVAQVLSRFSSATLSNVIHLELNADDEEGPELQCMTNFEWLDLLEQFPKVKTLFVSSEVSGYVAFALEDITEDMVTEVLPSLEFIYLDTRAVPLSVENFVAVRRLAGRPVIVVCPTG